MNHEKINKEQNKEFLCNLRDYFRMIHEESRCHMFIDILDLMINAGDIYIKQIDDENVHIKIDGVEKFWIEKTTYSNKECKYTVFFYDSDLGKVNQLLRYFPTKLISWDEIFSEDDIITHNECFGPYSKTNQIILDKIAAVLKIANVNDDSIKNAYIKSYLKLLENEINNPRRIIRLDDKNYMIEFNDNANFKIIIKHEMTSYMFYTIDSSVRYFNWSVDGCDLLINFPHNEETFVFKNRFDTTYFISNLKDSYEARRIFQLLKEIEKDIQS